VHRRFGEGLMAVIPHGQGQGEDDVVE